MTSLFIRYKQEKFVIHTDNAEVSTIVYLISDIVKASIRAIDLTSNVLKEWQLQDIIIEWEPIRIKYCESNEAETFPSLAKSLTVQHRTQSKLERFKMIELILSERGILNLK